MNALRLPADVPRMSEELLFDTLDNPYIPQEPTLVQLAFLELECRDALLGGAGGGGKSSGLLMAALQFAHMVPGYAALIVRRHFADLKLPGGLIDRSLDWLRGKAKWNPQEHRWRFDNGATLQFGYADKEGDEERYHGAEFQFVALDEGVQFTEKQIRFFAGERIRRKEGINVPLRFRIATTPGGVGHEFLKRRYIDPGTPGKAFVPARLHDNPHLHADEYVESLQEVDPLRRRQILDGDWDAVAGGRFKPEWLAHVWVRDRALPDWVTLHHALPDGSRREVEKFNWRTAATFQTYDPSASASTAADEFAVSTWKLTPKANVAWWGCHKDRMNVPDQVRVARKLYKEHRPQFVAVEKVLNQTAPADFLRESTDPPVVVRAVSPGGRDKLTRAAGGIILAESGRLFLPDAHPTFPIDEVRGELVRFTGLGDKETDNVVDTLSYMTECLHFVRPGGPLGANRAPFAYVPGQGRSGAPRGVR